MELQFQPGNSRVCVFPGAAVPALCRACPLPRSRCQILYGDGSQLWPASLTAVVLGHKAWESHLWLQGHESDLIRPPVTRRGSWTPFVLPHQRFWKDPAERRRGQSLRALPAPSLLGGGAGKCPEFMVSIGFKIKRNSKGSNQEFLPSEMGKSCQWESDFLLKSYVTDSQLLKTPHFPTSKLCC